MKNKSTLKKVLIIIGFCALCGLIGGIVGFCSIYISDALANIDISKIATDITIDFLPIILLVISTVFITVGLMNYNKAKKLIENWNGEDEKTICTVEYSLNKGLFATTLESIFSTSLITVWIILFIRNIDVVSIFKFLLLAFIYFCGNVATIVLQHSLVELIKKVNPEKKGDTLDIFSFAKDWEGSYDEGEMLVQYKAAFKSYRAMVWFCIALLPICLFADVLFKTGIFPIIIVVAIMLVMIITNFCEVIKLENKRNGL